MLPVFPAELEKLDQLPVVQIGSRTPALLVDFTHDHCLLLTFETDPRVIGRFVIKQESFNLATDRFTGESYQGLDLLRAILKPVIIGNPTMRIRNDSLTGTTTPTDIEYLSGMQGPQSLALAYLISVKENSSTATLLSSALVQWQDLLVRAFCFAEANIDDIIEAMNPAERMRLLQQPAYYLSNEKLLKLATHSGLTLEQHVELFSSPRHSSLPMWHTRQLSCIGDMDIELAKKLGIELFNQLDTSIVELIELFPILIGNKFHCSEAIEERCKQLYIDLHDRPSEELQAGRLTSLIGPHFDPIAKGWVKKKPPTEELHRRER